MKGIVPVENILNYVKILLEKYPTLKITVLAILKSPYFLDFHPIITKTNSHLKYELPFQVSYINANRTLIYPKYYMDIKF